MSDEVYVWIVRIDSIILQLTSIEERDDDGGIGNNRVAVVPL
jgi:hypothetical protein